MERIAHIELGTHLYGGAAQVRYLAQGLAARGLATAAICARGGELAADLRAAPASAVEVIEVPARGDLDWGSIGRLRAALRAFRPDVVHMHSRRGGELFGGIAAARERVAAVLTRRVEAFEPAFLARRKYRPYARVIAISSAIERDLVQRVALERARVQRIASAVDTERYAPDVTARARLEQAASIEPGTFAIGVVAQLIARKGHALLFAELGALVRQYPQVRVLCFGRGPLAAALAREVAGRGLERYVRFLGHRADLPALLPGLDLVVHPAEREGLGAALLEGASAGVAVVACAVGGVVDAVEHEVTGLLVPARDGPALRAAVARLIASGAERSRFGEAGRARMHERFSVERMLERHLELYAGL